MIELAKIETTYGQLTNMNDLIQPTSISLLALAMKSDVDEEAWKNLHAVYSPLIQRWLRGREVVGVDADDLAQEVMIVVMRKLPSFSHNGRTGAFRKWLRMIVFNCTRDFWKAKRIRPKTMDDTAFLRQLDELKSDSSELTQKWNLEHDQLVMQQLLKQAEETVQPTTWQAFQLCTIELKEPDEVAREVGISLASVYAAKSRVLARLRQLSDELID
jgi:RNA polymerase sigma-70 factor (ECF subfamily)